MFVKSQAVFARGASRRAASTLSTKSGLKVYSADDGRAVSELTLVFNGGSRFESAPGVAALAGKFAFRDTRARSALRLTRESELLGGVFGSQLGREKLVLTTKFLREDLPYYVETLANVAKSTLFRPHELTEQVLPLARLQASLARANPVTVARENAHAVAFRNGLGNSPLLPAGASPSLDAIREHALKVYSKNNATLYARGVNTSDVDEFVGTEFADLAAGEALTAPKAAGFGGDSRVLTAGPEHVVVLAFATTVSPTLEVLKYVLDSKPVKWSPGVGLLNKLVENNSTDVSVEHKTYSDASYFEVTISGPSADEVATVTREAAKIIKELGSKDANPDQVKRAHNQAKFVRAEAETDFHISEEFAEVNDVEVKSGVKELLKTKPVVAAVGNTYKLPYADELF